MKADANNAMKIMLMYVADLAYRSILDMNLNVYLIVLNNFIMIILTTHASLVQQIVKYVMELLH